MTIPCLRPKRPWLLSDASPEREELLRERDELNAAVARVRKHFLAVVNGLGKNDAFEHVNGLADTDLARFRDVLDDALSDLTYSARTWLDNRLEEID